MRAIACEMGTAAVVLFGLTGCGWPDGTSPPGGAVASSTGSAPADPASGSGSPDAAAPQTSSGGPSIQPPPDGGTWVLSCPEAEVWQPSGACAGASTTFASSATGVLTVLWAADDGIYFGGQDAATEAAPGSGFLELALEDGTARKVVWTGPGTPVAGASIAGHALLASYGPRNGYVYDLSVSPVTAISSGFWGMDANLTATATAQAWYLMEATNDVASVYRVDLSGNDAYLGTVRAGAALTTTGKAFHWLAGDIMQAPVDALTTSSVFVDVPRSTHLYDMVTDGSRLFVIAGGDVVRVDPSGAPTCLVRLGGPARLAYHAGKLYVAEPSFGRITAIDVQTNQPTCFDSSAGYIGAMAATDKALYWIDQTARTVESQPY